MAGAAFAIYLSGVESFLGDKATATIASDVALDLGAEAWSASWIMTGYTV